MKRPIGVSIIAGFFLVTGPLQLFFTLSVLFSQSAFESSLWDSFEPDILLFYFASSIGLIILGFGLWKLKLWSWWGTIAMFIVNTALVGSGVIKYTASGSIIDFRISILVSLAVVYYLVRVKNVFNNMTQPVKN